MAQARFIQPGNSVDHTPSVAKLSGDVVLIGTIPGVMTADCAASTLGAASIEGVFDVAKKTGAQTAGDPVYWDVDGDPVGGTAGTGAATSSAADGNLMGVVVTSAGSSDASVRVKLTAANRTSRIPTTTVAAAGTNQATAAALSEGFNLVTGADDTKGVVLPAASAGKQVIIKVGDGADLKVWPASGDAINAIAANSAMTVVDDVCFMLIALDDTTWYSLPLLPS